MLSLIWFATTVQAYDAIISGHIQYDKLKLPGSPVFTKQSSSLCECRKICTSLTTCKAYSLFGSSTARDCSIFSDAPDTGEMTNEELTTTWYVPDIVKQEDGRNYFFIQEEMIFTDAEELCQSFHKYALPTITTNEQLNTMIELSKETTQGLWTSLWKAETWQYKFGDGTNFPTAEVTVQDVFFSLLNIDKKYFQFSGIKFYEADITEKYYPLCCEH